MEYYYLPHIMSTMTRVPNTGPTLPVTQGRPPCREEVFHLVQDLRFAERRDNALLELSKRRESLTDLAPILWHSFGTIVALIQEIISIYPDLAVPEALSGNASNRVCNSLALLQCVASHPDTRPLFLRAHIPQLLYPFLQNTNEGRPFEYLKLTSLGVIGALVKEDDPEVVDFLMTTEIFPLCLQIMETGNELSMTVATFIVQKLLCTDKGLEYICQTIERVEYVCSVLAKVVQKLHTSPSIRLLKHVVRCYLRLADNHNACGQLRVSLPECLRVDPTLQQLPEPLADCVREDSGTRRWLQQLLAAVYR